MDNWETLLRTTETITSTYGFNIDEIDESILTDHSIISKDDLKCAANALQTYHDATAISADFLLSYLKSDERTHTEKNIFCLLVSKGAGICPYELLLSINSKDDFWNIIHYLEPLFSNYTPTNIDIILKCNAHVFDLLTDDLMAGHVNSQINKSLSNSHEICQEILKSFYVRPDEKLRLLVFAAFTAMINHSMNDAIAYIRKFISADNPTVKTAGYTNAAQETKDGNILGYAIAEEIIQSCKLEDNLNVRAYGCLFLFKTILTFQDNRELFEQVRLLLLEILQASDFAKYQISHQFIKEDLPRTKVLSEILESLFATRVNKNYGLIRDLDMIVYGLIKKSAPVNAYKYLKIFALINCDSGDNSVRELFQSTFSEIKVPVINQLMPSINADLISDARHRTFALIFFSHFAGLANFSQISFLNGLTRETVFRAIIAVTTGCFFSKLVCFLSIKYLENDLPTALFSQYYDFCLTSVAYNYKGTMREAIDTYDIINKNQQKTFCCDVLKMLDHVSSAQNLATSIPALRPSFRRLQQYAIAERERNKSIQKESERKSVLLNLVTRKAFKYGSRYAVLPENEISSKIIESAYSKFSYSLELPVVYINDPIQRISDLLLLKEIEDQ